jgi:lipopolysaccharide/colanic/teichoic acid biosynthesis glycosyltransferase
MAIPRTFNGALVNGDNGEEILTGVSEEGIIVFRQGRLLLSLYWLVKRGFDVLFSGLVLLLLSPIVLLVSILIKLDSRGPVIFRQQRIGQDRRNGNSVRYYGLDRRQGNLKGKPFTIFKFRTMRVDSPKYATTPNGDDDPRLTRVGRVLRRTCIDEVPQLFNVLNGDMSFVGPRPEMPFIVQTYNSVHCRRLKVKPGLTGLWQLKGSRRVPIHKNLHYDLHYIKKQSLWLDFKIIMQTMLFALSRKNF